VVPRFYAPAMTADSATVTLPEEEASHLVRVLRLGPGDEVRVFDGRGLERVASVARATRSIVDLTLGARIQPAPEPRIRVTLAQALLKADKFDGVLRDAVMLGVAAVRPLAAARIDVPAAAWRDGGRLERWQRVVVSSVKQCGRAVVPGVLPVADVAGCLTADTADVRIMLVEPSRSTPERAVRALDRGGIGDASSVLVLVGPEGGWSHQEVDDATAAGCRLVTLGRRVLRADAAPLVALAVLLHLAGDL
jgi:16S rRNA (uracil1498-N3)-methyltransferase